MKINKKILTTLAAPALIATVVAPAVTLASCGNKSYLEETRDIILKEFKTICSIPHPSDKILREAPSFLGNCDEISNYLKDIFTELVGREKIIQDDWGNLIIDVPANDDSFKDYPVVGLQAHMDMVFSYDKQKWGSVTPVPEETKIECVDEVVDGKRVLHSKDYKTTLGADDGIGLSTIIAICKSKTIKHGPLKVILTNCEERAMQGAQLLVEGWKDDEHPEWTIPGHKADLKDLKYLVNLDWEDLGDTCVGCSGGVGSYYEQTFEHSLVTDNLNKFDILISDFKGGHSGTDISNFIANPIKFMTQLILNLQDEAKLELIDFATPGVIAYNKIPNKCSASIATTKTMDDIKAAFKKTLKEFKEQKSSDGDKRKAQHPLQYENEDWNEIEKSFFVKPNTDAKRSINAADTLKILKLQNKLDFGVNVWPTDEEMAKFTGEQTSASVGPVIIGDEFKEGDTEYVTYTFASYSRSTVASKVDAYYASNQTDAKLIGEKIAAGDKKGESTYSSDAKFPSWENNNQDMANLAREGWLAAGIKPEKATFSRTHGGVENAWWFNATDSKIKQASIGAQLHHCHEVEETCEVDSIIPFLSTTIYILQHVKQLEK